MNAVVAVVDVVDTLHCHFPYTWDVFVGCVDGVAAAAAVVVALDGAVAAGHIAEAYAAVVTDAACHHS